MIMTPAELITFIKQAEIAYQAHLNSIVFYKG